jgi:hypothetical protein
VASLEDPRGERRAPRHDQGRGPRPDQSAPGSRIRFRAAARVNTERCRHRCHECRRDPRRSRPASAGVSVTASIQEASPGGETWRRALRRAFNRCPRQGAGVRVPTRGARCAWRVAISKHRPRKQAGQRRQSLTRGSSPVRYHRHEEDTLRCFSTQPTPSTTTARRLHLLVLLVERIRDSRLRARAFLVLEALCRRLRK